MRVCKEKTKQVRLINVIGIDGAGKTTLAKSLVLELGKQDPTFRYRYCQYFAKLLYPLKMLAKLSVMNKTDEFKDYGSYNKTKKKTSSRFPLLASIYAGTWLLDYIIQVFFKITLPLVTGQHLIVDRYIFDIAVNLSLATNKDVGYVNKYIDFFFMFAPKPDLIVFIDLPEETALSRKHDIQDI